MQSSDDRRDASVFWLAALVPIIGLVTAAFWSLLGYRYSPEIYETGLHTPDTIEFIWYGLSLVAGIVSVVWLLRQRELWRRIFRSTSLLLAVAVLILSKTWLGASLRCYDMILFCAAFGWTVMKVLPLVFEERTGRDVASARFLGPVVWLGVLLLALFYYWQQLHYWNNLALGYSDCAEYGRLLNNTVFRPHEMFLVINPDKPMFWGHFEPGALLFAPLWALWPELPMLFALQAIVIVGVSLPLYWIGRHVFQERVAALLLVVAWLVYPSATQLAYSASYGFHFGNVCLPLYFLALAFWLKGKSGRALAAAVGALLMKEEAAIVIGMFGLYVALCERRPRLGMAITVVAFGYFILITTMVIPSVKLGFYPQLRFFADLGHSKWEIFLSPLTKPRLFWGKLLEVKSFYFAAALLAPLLFLPLRKPSILFVGALTFVFDCLYPAFKSISFHYQAALLPVVFWALAFAVQGKPPRLRRAALLGVVGSGILMSVFLGNVFWSKDTLAITTWPGRIDLVRRFSTQIDPRGSLFATQRAAAHFVAQHHLYIEDPVPEEIDYALLDSRDSWSGAAINLNWLQRLRAFQREVEANPRLHLVAAEDGLLLYSRQGIPLDPYKIVERDGLPDSATMANKDLGGGIRLVGFTVSPLSHVAGENLDRVRVTAFSSIATPTNIDFAMRCFMNAGGDAEHPEMYASDFQPLGQCVWPTARWETNKLYADDFIIVLPLGMAGRVSRVAFKAVALSAGSAE
jgi:uncharacterized membrane protein